MEAKISPAIAQELAQKLGMKQVIITAWDGTNTHVVTYGVDVVNSDQAATGGNKIKSALGWPEALMSKSPQVEAIEQRLERLEATMNLVEKIPTTGNKYAVYVVSVVEMERGWGQRPDGFIVFKTEKDALEYNRRKQEEMLQTYGSCAPDCYDRYGEPVVRSAGKKMILRLASSQSGYACIDKLEELDE